MPNANQVATRLSLLMCELHIVGGEQNIGPTREEVPVEWGKLHKKFHNLYCLPNVTKVMKSCGMRWVGHVPCVREF